MEEELVVQLLFAGSVVVAALSAFAKARAKVFKEKVEPIALSLALAAAAFFVQVTNFFN